MSSSTTRRWWSLAVGLVLGICWSGTAVAELSAERVADKNARLEELCENRLSPEVREIMARTEIVDMHAHTFNFRYLPLKGILYRFNLSVPVARILAGILIGVTESGEFGSPDEEADIQPLASLLNRLTKEDRAELLRHEKDIRKALERTRRREVATAVEEPMTLRHPPEESGLPGDEAMLMLLELLGEAVHPEESRQLALLMEEEAFIGQLDGFMDMLAILTQREDRIVQRLIGDYSMADTFVHYMMDMEHVYDSAPAYDLNMQLERVGHLGELYAGTLLFAVAFDPFRGPSAITHVERGLESGGVAVKFYPPSGYRPSSNVIPKKPKLFRFPISAQIKKRKQWKSRYGGRTPDDLNKAVLDLFKVTHGRQVPVFSHHTPQGFEALGRQGDEPGYGELMAAPCYWQKILDTLSPEFRLILAHSGGGDAWFGNGPWEGSFDQQAYNLCVQYPNVYCDFGMSLEVLTPEGREAFASRLKALIARSVSPEAPRMESICDSKSDAQPRYDILDKLMYGSDWHMMSRVPDADDLICSFGEVFSTEGLEEGTERFFGLNSARILGQEE